MLVVEVHWVAGELYAARLLALDEVGVLAIYDEKRPVSPVPVLWPPRCSKSHFQGPEAVQVSLTAYLPDEVSRNILASVHYIGKMIEQKIASGALVSGRRCHDI